MRRTRQIRWIGVLALATFVQLGAAFAQDATLPAPPGTRAVGTPLNVEGEEYVGATDSPSTIVVGDATSDNLVVTCEVQIPEKGARMLWVRVAPKDPADHNTASLAYLTLHPFQDHELLMAHTYRYDHAKKENVPAFASNFAYKPYANEPAAKQLEADGIPSGSYRGRWIPIRAELANGRGRLWVEGRLMQDEPADGAKGPVAITLYGAGMRVRNIKIAPAEGSSTGLFVPVDISLQANAKSDARGALGIDASDSDVPFDVPSGENARGDIVDLRPARWVEWRQDPADYYEHSDGGPPMLHDPRMPFFRVPNADYVAMHVLASADGAEHTVPRFAVRAGRYGYSEQVIRHDFTADVPVDKEGRFTHVRVPMPDAFAQDLRGFLEFELNRPVYLARRVPDPCRFRFRPAGLPSGVKIAAITLEKSPLQMKVTSGEHGHVFVEPQKPAFKVSLTNITDEERSYTLQADATHYHGQKTGARHKGKVAAGQTAEVTLDLGDAIRGYHDLQIHLMMGGREPLLTRTTSFALVPPDTREHRESAPWGTWDFGPTHFGNPDAEQHLSLLKKAGIRYASTGTAELRAKYGVTKGSEPQVVGTPEQTGVSTYEDGLKRDPDQMKMALLYHEGSLSYDHIVKPPDFLLDWPEYQFSADEAKRWETFFDAAVAAAKEMRAKHPDVKLSLGNGTVTTREEFLRRKFPAELFDYLGNESGNFSRPPESQPPDAVANNASLWMDQQLLEIYGYDSKAVQQCYEAGYVNTNPGNVDLKTQADYYVRHFMHALAWEIPYIRYAMLADVGNSYYYSNWGASGLCNRYPENNPKPAYVAVATMTLLLDGAKFVRDINTGSPSVYALEFDRPDGSKTWVMWTLRGERPVRLRLAGEKADLVNDQAIATPLKAKDGWVNVTLTPSPVYVIAPATLTDLDLGTPRYDDKPADKSRVVAKLDSLDGWEVQTTRDAHLEFYGLFRNRRQGDFAFEPVDQFEGQRGAIKITPRPITRGKDTMPMYGAIVHKEGVALPGQPTAIGVWVNGNSGFGSVMYELTDASGQTWTSIGAPSADPLPHWLDRVVPEELKSQFTPPERNDWNTEDLFGWAEFNFDGWRYVEFPLPGQYAEEGGKPGLHRPENSQWRWDKDGVVHFPLTLRRIIVELPEKALHVRTFAPPPRSEVYLRNVVVIENPPKPRLRGVD